MDPLYFWVEYIDFENGSVTHPIGKTSKNILKNGNYKSVENREAQPIKYAHVRMHFGEHPRLYRRKDIGKTWQILRTEKSKSCYKAAALYYLEIRTMP